MNTVDIIGSVALAVVVFVAVHRLAATGREAEREYRRMEWELDDHGVIHPRIGREREGR